MRFIVLGKADRLAEKIRAYDRQGPLVACGSKALRLIKIKSTSTEELDWNIVFMH